jgi:YD repeat-containing protein
MRLERRRQSGLARHSCRRTGGCEEATGAAGLGGQVAKASRRAARRRTRPGVAPRLAVALLPLVALLVAQSLGTPSALAQSSPLGWSARTVDSSGSPQAVSCASTGFCVAVDYRGDAWSAPEAVDAGMHLDSVSCPSTDFCAAVDWLYQSGSVTADVVTFDGTSWSSPTQLASDYLNGVSCSSSSFCVAVGAGGDAYTYDGTSWSVAQDIDSSGSGYLTAVSCASTSFCAATDSGGYVLTYNGTSWTTPTQIDSTDGLYSVSCPTASFCVAADDVSNAYSWNGSSWSSMGDIDSAGDVNSVSCTSSSFCAAVGYSGTAVTYDGTSWTAAYDADGSATLSSVSCPEALVCEAVDTSGNALLGEPGITPLPALATAGGCNYLQPAASQCAYASAVGQPVNVESGDFYETATDVSLPALGGALRFARTYDSNVAQASSSPGPVGYGWTDNWASALLLNTPSSGDVTVQGPSGAETTFVPQSSCEGPYQPTEMGGQYCALPDTVGSLSLSGGTYTLTIAGGTTETFNSTGQLTSQTDPHGNTIDLAYGSESPGQGNCPSNSEVPPTASCETVTAPGGRALTFGWSQASESGEITSVTDALGNRWLYGYCTSSSPGEGTTCLPGDLITVTDPLGNTTTYTYTSTDSASGGTYEHDLQSVQEPATTGSLDVGAVSTLCSNKTSVAALDGFEVNCYDSSGRVVVQQDAAGLATSFDYSQMNATTGDGTVAVTDPHGNVTDYLYSSGLLSEKTTGAGTAAALTWQYGYDPLTLLRTSVTDPNGNETTWSYDSNGHVLTMTDPIGDETSYCYNPDTSKCSDEKDPFGNVYQVTPPVGAATVNTYDSTGDLLTSTVKGSAASPSAPDLETEHSYYSNGELACTVSPAEVASGVSCPATAGNWVSGVTAYSYNSSGDLTSTKDPDGNVTTNAYNEDGELYCSISPKVNAEGGVSCPSYGSSYPAKTTWDVYDGDGELTSSTNPDGDETTYSYDANGNQSLVTDPSGNETKSTYDGDGRLTSTTDGYGSSSSSEKTYGYDVSYGTAPCTASISGASYCDTTTEEMTSSTNYEIVDYYDASDRLVGEVLPAGTTGDGVTTYTYDVSPGSGSCPSGSGASYCDTVTNDLGTKTETYDSDNRLTGLSYSTGAPAAASYSYNADSERTSMSDASGTTTYSYDSDGRMTEVTDGAGTSTTYGYDDSGNVTCISYPGATTSCADSGNTTGTDLVNYSFDPAGQMSSVTDWNGKTTNFSYDGNGNLTTTSFPNSSIQTSFDNANLLQQSSFTSGSTTLASISDAWQPNGLLHSEADGGTYLSGTTNYGYDAQSRVTSAGPTTYGYDAFGDLTTTSGASVSSYNGAGELTATTNGAFSTSYGYDAVGNRTSSTPLVGEASAYGYNAASQMTATTPGNLYGEVASGWDHSLALTAWNKLYAWGNNASGQLGDGTTTSSSVPVPVTGFPGNVFITQVAAGYHYSVGLDTNGHVWAWGDNSNYQLGATTPSQSSTPVEVSGLSNIVAVSAGYNFVLALRNDGTVWAWGSDYDGQLGNGTTSATPVATPVEVAGLSGVTGIAAGGYHALAVTGSGEVYSWGYNASGQHSGDSDKRYYETYRRWFVGACRLGSGTYRCQHVVCLAGACEEREVKARRLMGGERSRLTAGGMDYRRAGHRILRTRVGGQPARRTL